jgi:hypothetical protein
MQTVYIETTIPSYLAAKPSSQPAVAADQQMTHDWWRNERSRFRLYTSVFTLDEAARGDAGAAAGRLKYLEGIPDLDIPPELPAIEGDIIRLFQLPTRATTDASHLALAVLHRMDYLLTWNCAHLANPFLQRELMEYCTYHNLHVPIICTPGSVNPTEIMKNEIIDEVRRARAALAAEHGFDRQRIFEWARAAHAAHQQAQQSPNPDAQEATSGEGEPPVTRGRRVRPSGAPA